MAVGKRPGAERGITDNTQGLAQVTGWVGKEEYLGSYIAHQGTCHIRDDMGPPGWRCWVKKCVRSEWEMRCGACERRDVDMVGSGC